MELSEGQRVTVPHPDRPGERIPAKLLEQLDPDPAKAFGGDGWWVSYESEGDDLDGTTRKVLWKDIEPT